MDRFYLNRRLKADELRDRFRRFGRLQVEAFLEPECASALRAELQRSSRWRHVINSGDKLFEIPADEFDSLDSTFRAQLDQATNRTAAFGFQYRYDSIRVSDDASARVSSPDLLDEFATFLSSERLLDLFGHVADCSDIRFADAQATRYRPGDFLTRHDDAVTGKHRSLAYVFNLVDEWRPEWGGTLMFLGDENRVVDSFVPRFNSLSLFVVGQQHFVSAVANFAPVERISVTGWLRNRRPASTQA